MPTLLCLPLVMVMTPMTHLLQLPQNERLALAIALWDSLDDPSRDGALPLDPALCAELDRRWANHRDNPEAAVAWDEVRSHSASDDHGCAVYFKEEGPEILVIALHGR